MNTVPKTPYVTRRLHTPEQVNKAIAVPNYLYDESGRMFHVGEWTPTVPGNSARPVEIRCMLYPIAEVS